MCVLCALLETELHLKESSMLTLASPVEPRQRHPGHLNAALTLALLTDKYNQEVIFHWHNTVGYTDLHQISSVTFLK